MENENTNANSQNDVKPTTKTTKERSLLICWGLAVGDSLGATSEFQIPWEVGKNCVETYEGWPAKLVGGGKAHWKVGQPTDDTDMALCILRAVHAKNGKFDPNEVLRYFKAWQSTGPKDIGHTTRTALYKAQKSCFEGGYKVYQKDKEVSANGSLMRNGVIPALFPLPEQEIEALDATVLQGIITHYNPTAVFVCVIQTMLIREALNAKEEIKNPPTLQHIKELLDTNWKVYVNKTTNSDVKMWIQEIGNKQLQILQDRVIRELEDFEKFDPYHQDYRGRSGYSVLTLKISLWALHWSFQTSHPAVPEWLPKNKFDCIMWVAAIGADADTYGASAGPLLAAYHPHIGENLLEGLQAKNLIQELLENKTDSLGRSKTNNKSE